MPAPRRHLAHWPDGVPRHLDLPARSIFDNLAQAAARFPDRPAVIFHGAVLDYAALLEQVEALAGALQARGVGRGDRVLLYMQNSPQFVIGYYAILRADAVVIPVNPMNRHAELAHLAHDTGARVALAGVELLAHVSPLVTDGALDHVIAAAYADMAAPDRDMPLPGPLDTLSGAMRPAPASPRGMTRSAPGTGPARTAPGPTTWR